MQIVQKTGEIPQLDKIDGARCFSTTVAWSEQKTVEVPQLQCSYKVVDVPVVQVVVVPQVQTAEFHRDPQFFSRCMDVARGVREQ